MTHASRALLSNDLSGEGINFGSHNTFLTTQETWRASPDEWSAQFRGGENTNIKDDNTIHSLTHSLKQDGYDKDDYNIRGTVES